MARVWQALACLTGTVRSLKAELQTGDHEFFLAEPSGSSSLRLSAFAIAEGDCCFDGKNILRAQRFVVAQKQLWRWFCFRGFGGICGWGFGHQVGTNDLDGL